MNEPTREQIKEAFNKTIERWEKIVEDVSYYNRSTCVLCELFPGAACKEKICPVAIYAKQSVCHGTPYWDFTHDKTPANALAELNFLRKVYIWWMEREEKGWAIRLAGEAMLGAKEEKKKTCGNCEDFMPTKNENYGHCADAPKSKNIKWLPSDSCSCWREKGRKVGVCRMCGCNYLQEDGGCSFAGYCKHKSPEEKKEEWEDYTHHISWETKDYMDAELPYLLYGTNYKGEEIVYVNETGKHICHNHKKEYRLEQAGETFRILKRV